jgi:hypothetical protein
MEWDPCTFNNNDWQEFPTYDGVSAALNWPFLATQGITQQNFYTTLRPWAIALQPDCAQGDQPSGPRLPAEWNMFGTHGVSFVQQAAKNVTTTITSGALSPTNRVTSDPLIGTPVAISGDRGGPGRLVDTNPAAFWSSQIYFAGMAFGSGTCVIRGPRRFRMHSRWLDLSRIYNADPALTQPAASVGCCFQTCIPYSEVTWPASSSGSALALQLQTAASQPKALGIMVRFTAYVNVYFKNGLLNDIQAQPRNYGELAKALADAWNQFNANGSTDLFFSNPCYSHIVGTLGVWNDGEVASAPVGRFLAATNRVAPHGVTPTPASPAILGRGHQMAAVAGSSTPPAVPLGPAVVQIDYDNELISIDLNSTIPELGQPGEWPSDLTKANFGSLDFGVVSGGTFTSIVEIRYPQYAKAAYQASAGIVDIPFSQTLDPSNTKKLLQYGTIAIQVQQPQGSNPPLAQTALLEQQLSAQTDRRGIYLDQRETTSFDVAVYDFGSPSANTTVLIAQYDQGLNLVPTQAMPLVLFTSGRQSTITSGGVSTGVTVVTTGGNGLASVGIASSLPGYAVLAFYPFSGSTLPSPLPSLFGPTMPITSAFYTTIRVLPFDDGLPRKFVDQWNAGQNQTAAWQFIYNEILYLYDMIFNVMLEFMNLGSQSAVQGAISQIWPLISAESAKENTMAMPITRDMSSGKRKTLQLWIYLVANHFNVPNFNVDSIPPGWKAGTAS